MTSKQIAMMAVAIGLFSGACSLSFVARDEKGYRDATRELLATAGGPIKACYEADLKQDAAASGTVVLHFKVAAETGKIFETRVDAASTAPDALNTCVLQAIDGLKLDPPDKREGHATFSWAFKPRA